MEHYTDIQAVFSSLREVIPRLFPLPTPDNDERTILSNRDISTSNILVSPTGDVTAIVDWECCAALPTSFSVQLHQFLKGPTRTSPPAYRDPSTPEAASEVYKTELELYERTCLRKFFLEEIVRQEPRWLQCFQEGQMCRDALLALDMCENDMTVKWVKGWVEFWRKAGCRGPV